jgi:hydrogenase/urease accessory protein HupE
MGMRNLVVLGVGLLVAYWYDQRYYHGATSAVVIGIFHDVAAGFK